MGSARKGWRDTPASKSQGWLMGLPWMAATLVGDQARGSRSLADARGVRATRSDLSVELQPVNRANVATAFADGYSDFLKEWQWQFRLVGIDWSWASALFTPCRD